MCIPRVVYIDTWKNLYHFCWFAISANSKSILVRGNYMKINWCVKGGLVMKVIAN